MPQLTALCQLHLARTFVNLNSIHHISLFRRLQIYRWHFGGSTNTPWRYRYGAPNTPFCICELLHQLIRQETVTEIVWS